MQESGEMKVSFVLLAHEAPERLKDLILGLLEAGSNVYVHHDATAKEDLERAVREWGVENLPGNIFFAKRVKVVWGEWSIVEATLNCLRLARSSKDDSDYFMLISGSCMPVKPIRFLGQYLKETGGDHIEAVDAIKHRWVTAGLQKRRWTKYHFFNWRFQPNRFHASLALQEKLKVNRTVPKGHTPHMGSQWWCLRGSTVSTLLKFLDKNPSVERFYKRTWVPDELFFQTLVANLVSKDEISSRPLTRYAFNSWGIPRVYYDDDFAETLAESRFFIRKVSHRAVELKRRLSKLAPMEIAEFQAYLASCQKELDEFKSILLHRREVENNRWYSLDSCEENYYDYVKSIPSRMVIVCGVDMGRKSQALQEFDKLEDTAVYGDLFDPDEVGKGYEGDSWLPINREDTKLAQHTWYKLLGDIAFHEPNKTIVFSLGKNALHYLEIFRWKHNVNIMLVDDKNADGLDKPILKEFYLKSKILHLIQERHCEFSRVELENLRYWVDEATQENLGSTHIIENMHRTQELVQWPSLLKNTDDHWELLKAIDSKIVIFVAKNEMGLEKVKNAMKSWLSSGVHTGIFDVISKNDDTLDWHYYLADVAYVNSLQSRHNALFSHMSGVQIELLNTLRWKGDLLVVYLDSDDEQASLEDLSFDLEGSLDKAKDIISGVDPTQERLDDILKERHCSYLKVTEGNLESIKGDVLEFVGIHPESEVS